MARTGGSLNHVDCSRQVCRQDRSDPYLMPPCRSTELPPCHLTELLIYMLTDIRNRTLSYLKNRHIYYNIQFAKICNVSC